MNKRFEAVPFLEWIKTNPAMGRYNGMYKNDYDVHQFYYLPSEVKSIKLSITHVLVPVEDEWISELPDNKECEDWYNANIGNDPEKPCSASSAIYKFREWLKERKIESDKEAILKFLLWYNRNEEKSKKLYERFISQATAPPSTQS